MSEGQPFAEYGARPVPVEDVIDALVDAGLLAERQATVFALREIEATPRGAVAEELDISTSTVDSTLQRAREKVASAEETIEIIEAARNRPLPDRCVECGETLGGRWTAREVERDGELVREHVCLVCADLVVDVGVEVGGGDGSD